MSLSHLQADLDAHLAARPVQPCPVSQMTPEQYAAWSRDLAAWANKRDTLANLAAGIPKTLVVRRAPACLPKADDYYYRGTMPRRRNAA